MNAALVISSADNVATALEPLDAGRTVQLGALTVTVTEAIPRGHKLALRAIGIGEQVLKYGSAIGTASAGRAASRPGARTPPARRNPSRLDRRKLTALESSFRRASGETVNNAAWRGGAALRGG